MICDCLTNNSCREDNRTWNQACQVPRRSGSAAGASTSSALALVDILDTELEQAVGIPLRWYDALVHLEESPEGIPMNELAERILYSKAASPASSTAWKKQDSSDASAPNTTDAQSSSSSPTKAPKR
jgi:hypothetical protein